MPIKINMANTGEIGIDVGGVGQEYFRLVFMEILKPEYGLFTIDARSYAAWFNPASHEPAYKFELIGMLMALAAHNGFVLNVTFPCALYMKLCGEAVGLTSIDEDWTELSQGLYDLADYMEDVETDIMRSYVFSYSNLDGSVTHVDISRPFDSSTWTTASAAASSAAQEEAAPLVTDANKMQYVEDYVAWLVHHSVHIQYDAFARGFYRVIAPNFLATTSWKTLQKVVEGAKLIDTYALEARTHYMDFTPSSRCVRAFWEIVHAFPQARVRQLLEFVTGSDRLPVNGIDGLDFMLQRNGPDSDNLPTSTTCFWRLLLPDYASKEKLEGKLCIALDNARGFGLR